MQALTATALRSATQEQGLLPDALLPLLQMCQITIEAIQRRIAMHGPILPKYPKLSRNGYLNLNEITTQEALDCRANYMETNVNRLRMQVQWVRCEESGAAQLNVFCAAPSFQSALINWKNENNG
jgi:hypothetical protein